MKTRGLTENVVRWFDAGAVRTDDTPPDTGKKVEWLRVTPFVVMHGACLGAIWTGWSAVAVGVAVGLYFVRMFAITAFYHRYFSHRTFSTSRAAQFAFGVLGASAVQRGPLWWAAHHRRHHRYSDQPGDPHSALRDGFWWSHIGWITSRANFPTDVDAVGDLAKFPELRFLNRFDTLVPVLLAAAMFGLGMVLASVAPELGTSGPQMLVWGFFISTVALFHGTCSINSLAHKMGRKRYPTGDESRNSFTLALITLGEGWHNNHHYCPGTVRQGFHWWQIDVSWYGLTMLSWLGIVWDLRPVPAHAYDAAHD